MIKIKNFLQTPGRCGSFSLKSIFDYYGFKISEKKISEISKTTRDHGTAPSNLVKTAKYFGFEAEYKEKSSISEVKKLTDSGIPVIISWFSGHESHYSIAIGVDKEYIYMADPEYKERKKIPLEAFERIWFDYNDKKELLFRPIIIIRKDAPAGI